MLLLAPVADSPVDRLPRGCVMVLADVVRVLLAAVLAVRHGSAPVAHLVAAGLSAGQVFSAAAQRLLSSLVEDDELVAANNGICIAAVTAQVLVAPGAALLAVQVGFGPAFGLNAGFALSAVLLRGLREPARPGRS